jgi:hypothetical protein
MNDEAAYLLHVAEAHVFPRLAAVGRFEDPVADAEIGSVQALAGADVEDVRMRRADGYVSYGAGGRIVEDRPPGATVVIGLPDPATMNAGIEDARLAGNADSADRAAGTKRPDEPIVKVLVERRIDGARGFAR